MDHSQGLEARELCKSYDGRLVLDQVSLTVSPGEVVGLLGPNGAGKTTLFRILMGALPSDSGAVWWRGEEISTLPVHRRARAGLGYLPQESSVFTGLSVEQNLQAVLQLRGRAFSRAEELLGAFGLVERRKQRAGALSGGERRRLELARLMALDADILLLDEPFRALDTAASEELAAHLLHYVKGGGGVLITDHRIPQVEAICSRTYFLSDGRVVSAGTPRDVVSQSKSPQYNQAGY